MYTVYSADILRPAHKVFQPLYLCHRCRLVICAGGGLIFVSLLTCTYAVCCVCPPQLWQWKTYCWAQLIKKSKFYMCVGCMCVWMYVCVCATVFRIFSSSKFLCKKFSRKIIFVLIELSEKIFTSPVYYSVYMYIRCIIVFVEIISVKIIFVRFLARIFLQLKLSELRDVLLPAIVLPVVHFAPGKMRKRSMKVRPVCMHC